MIDFTQFSTNEILQYFQNQTEGKTCGRLKTSQIEAVNNRLTLTIRARKNQPSANPLPAYIFGVGAMLATGCETAKPTPNETHQVAQNTTTDSMANCQTTQQPIDTDDDTDLMIMGDIAEPFHFFSVADASAKFDREPAYKIDFLALNDYVQKNLQYPEWERKRNIQGNVVVRCTIDATGRVQNPKIISTVEGSKNFDKEVLRLVNNMEPWIPATYQGKNIPIDIDLTIRFELF